MYVYICVCQYVCIYAYVKLMYIQFVQYYTHVYLYNIILLPWFLHLLRYAQIELGSDEQAIAATEKIQDT